MDPIVRVLVDVSSTGKVRPWAARRKQTLMLAGSFRRLGFHRNAERCEECGKELVFRECPNGHERYLERANFCRQRLCPMCQWRRSLKVAHQLKLVAHEAMAREPLRFLMLTLTVRNVPGEDIRWTLQAFSKGWGRLVRKKEVRVFLRGWFRAYEVTYNEDRDDYHPHAHVLLAVRPSYFTRYYMRHEEWVRLWQESMRLDYAPSVDVRPIRRRRSVLPGEVEVAGESEADVARAVAEVGKYATDPGDWLLENREETTDRVVRTLHGQLAGAQLVAYGGLLRKVYGDLLAAGRVDDVEEGSLVHVEEDPETKRCSCSVCGSDLLEQVYRWKIGWGVYYADGLGGHHC